MQGYVWENLLFQSTMAAMWVRSIDSWPIDPLHATSKQLNLEDKTKRISISWEFEPIVLSSKLSCIQMCCKGSICAVCRSNSLKGRTVVVNPCSSNNRRQDNTMSYNNNGTIHYNIIDVLYSTWTWIYNQECHLKSWQNTLPRRIVKSG